VPGLTGVTRIAAGDGFSLALRSDGTAWAWGNNYDGELGDGATDSSSVPVQVSGLSQVTSIAAGIDSALAIRTQGITTVKTVQAWGGNSSGQLGDGSTAGVTGAVLVPGLSGVSQVSAGGDFSLAIHHALLVVHP